MTMIPLDTHKAIKDLIDSGLNEKQAETFIGVINDIYDQDFVHVITVSDLSEINNKFRM